MGIFPDFDLYFSFMNHPYFHRLSYEISIFDFCQKSGVSRNSNCNTFFLIKLYWYKMKTKRSPAAAKEQLITEIVSLERESQPRQRMMAMLEAFRLWDANYVDVFFCACLLKMFFLLLWTYLVESLQATRTKSSKKTNMT